MPRADSQGEGFVYQAAELLWMEYVRSRGIAVARAGDKHRAEYVLRSGGQCARGLAVTIQSGLLSFIGNFLTAVRPRVVKLYAEGNNASMYRLTFMACKISYFLMFASSCRWRSRWTSCSAYGWATTCRNTPASLPHHPRSGAGRVVPFGIPHGFPCHRQDEDGQHGVRLVDDPYAPCRIHRLEDGASALFGVRHHPCQQRRLPRVQLGVNAPLCAVQLLAACHGGLSALHIGDPLRPACAGIRPCQYAARLASLSGFVAMQRAGLRLFIYTFGFSKAEKEELIYPVWRKIRNRIKRIR